MAKAMTRIAVLDLKNNNPAAAAEHAVADQYLLAHLTLGRSLLAAVPKVLEILEQGERPVLRIKFY